MLSMLLVWNPKQGYVVVRKPNDNNHVHCDQYRAIFELPFVFLDDMVACGNTYHRVDERIGVKGVLLYAQSKRVLEPEKIADKIHLAPEAINWIEVVWA